MLNTKQLRQSRKEGSFCTCSNCEARDSYLASAKPVIWLVMALISMIVILAATCAHAEQRFSDHDAILSVIGEAENQGFEGMLAVSHAIRNRGTLKGVFGLAAPRVKQHKYTEITYKQARKAWMDSAHTPDITNGATNWENESNFGIPYWAHDMKMVAVIGDHVFMRRKL